MKTGPGAWFVKTGCFVCHSISALGVKSPAQIGPDLSTAVEDTQSRFGRTVDDFLKNPTGTMAVVLSRQIILTPDAEGGRDPEAARGVRRAPEAEGRREAVTDPAGVRRSSAASARHRSRLAHGRDRGARRGGGQMTDKKQERPDAGRPRRDRRWSASWPAAAPRARRRAQEGAGAARPTWPSPRRRPTSRPGDLDEYYLFSSGGHSGQIYVYGVPSMRHLSTIPVFTPYPGTGYGFDDEIEGDAGRPHLGRRPPPGALRDQRRLRRPLALHQRHERPRSRASTCATSRRSRSSGRSRTSPATTARPS